MGSICGPMYVRPRSSDSTYVTSGSPSTSVRVVCSPARSLVPITPTPAPISPNDAVRVST